MSVPQMNPRPSPFVHAGTLRVHPAARCIARGLAVAALAVGAARAQWATVVDGPALNALNVRTLDESAPAGPGTVTLQNVEFLPMERTGRTVAQGLQSLEPRVARAQGIERLELPGAQRLFHYRRNQGAVWGYLHVRTDGTNAAVLEEPAVAGASPFADRVAIAADGTFMAVPGAPADLWLVRLDGQNFASTGTPSRRIAVPPGVEVPGVMVTAGSVFYVDGNDRLFRVGRADGALPVDVTPPGAAGAEVKDALAVSGDQQTVAFLFGPRPNFRIYRIGDAGAATLLPPPPAKYEEPGYLPEDAGHPRLLLNQDATRLLYVDGTVRDEVYVLNLQTGVSLHVTQDLIFQPYIGVIILPSFEGAALVAAIGDPNRMDWFKVDAGFNVTNLTNTGNPLPPYPSGTIDPLATSIQGGRVLATERTATGAQNLRFVDPTSGATGLLRTGLAAPVVLGSAFQGAADLLIDTGTRSLVLDPLGQSLLPIPVGIHTTPTAIDPTGQIRLTAVELGGGFRLPVFRFQDGSLAVGLFEQGITQTVFTNGGGAFINGPTLRYVGLGVAASRAPFGAVTVFLSGSGA